MGPVQVLAWSIRQTCLITAQMEVCEPPCNSQRLGVGSEHSLKILSFSHLNHLPKWHFLPSESLTPTAQKCCITASTQMHNFHLIIRATRRANFPLKLDHHSGIAALQKCVEEGTLKGRREKSGVFLHTRRLEWWSGEPQEGRRWIEVVYLRHQSHCNRVLHLDAKRRNRGGVMFQWAPGQASCDQTGLKLLTLRI